MTVSVRTRFEVFKRDRFTCSYCGQTPPNVLLEVDHVVPRAAGGSDDITNLTTSCKDCNRGKAAGLLEEGTAPVVGRAVIEEMQERLDQARAYMETLSALQDVTDQMVDRVIAYWARVYQAELEEREDATYYRIPGGEFPERGSIRRFLRTLPLSDVLEAVDKTAGRLRYGDNDACRYFYGVCHRMIREREGRG